MFHDPSLIKVMSIASIVVTLAFGVCGSAYVHVHWGFICDWIILLVAIFMLINVYALHEACCYQVGWIIVVS